MFITMFQFAVELHAACSISIFRLKISKYLVCIFNVATLDIVDFYTSFIIQQSKRGNHNLPLQLVVLIGVLCCHLDS